MIEITDDYLSNFSPQVQTKDTHIHQKELDLLLFSIWIADHNKGHSLFVGNIIEIAQFLEKDDRQNLEVAALDLEQMRSLEPVPANNWLMWYYQTALSLLEENDFDESVLVPYPTNSMIL